MDGGMDGSVLVNRGLWPAQFPNIATVLETANKIDFNVNRCGMSLEMVGHTHNQHHEWL